MGLRSWVHKIFLCIPIAFTIFVCSALASTEKYFALVVVAMGQSWLVTILRGVLIEAEKEIYGKDR